MRFELESDSENVVCTIYGCVIHIEYIIEYNMQYPYTVDPAIYSHSRQQPPSVCGHWIWKHFLSTLV